MSYFVFNVRWWAVLAALLPAVVPPVRAAVETSAYATAVTVLTNNAGNRSLLIDLAPTGQVEVVPFAPDLIRVRFHFAGLYEREEVAISKAFTNWPAFTQTFSQPSPTNFLIETDALTVSIVLSNAFGVHFYSPAGRPLLLDRRMEYDVTYSPIDDTTGYAQVGWPGESTSISNLPSGFKLRAVKNLGTDDAFFGLGDTAGGLNRRGMALQFWGQDTYQFGEGRTPKYTALPMLYGVLPPGTQEAAAVYGLFFNNPARPVFSLYGPDDTWSFEAGDDQLDYFFFGGGDDHTMAGVIGRFAELTGRPVMLPKWALGYHQSRHSYFTQQRVLDLAADMRTNGFPCDAIYLDIGSQNVVNGQNAQLTFNADYTNVPGLVQAVADLGMKLVPLVEPLLTTNDPLYAEAETNLYFLKNNDLSTYVGTNFLGRISWLDFSIDPAATWWGGLLTNYLAAYGFEGIWNDLNEPNENAMPLDVVWFLQGRYGGGLATNDSRKWHSNNKNTYNIWESRITYDALRAQFPDKRPFVLSRGAWPGIQQYAAGWSGDNVASFDHLRFNTTLGLNVMLSGQAWYGHDIGGFVGDTNPELLVRWIQSGALNPMFRNHTTLDTIDQEPWLFGATETLWNRHWIRFRYEMMPTLYSLAAASTTNGIPLNVPTVFHFPGDTNTYSMNDYDYMVGPDLLIAPVYTSGAGSRSVYLPAGTAWYSWTTGLRHEGGQAISEVASLGTLPRFSRAGALLVRGPAMLYANEFLPEALDILHWAGGTNAFLLYEDDGETTNFTAGGFAHTPMQVVSATNALTFTVEARQGGYDPGARDFYLVMRDANEVDAVWLNSNALARVINRNVLEQGSGAGWAYDRLARTLTVRFADDGGHRVVQASFPVAVDSDGDGLPDAWEQVFFGSPTGAVAAADSDSDGRDNLAEFRAGSHPLRADTFVSKNTPAPFTNMAVAGTFTLWNQKADNMRLVADGRWVWVTDLTGHTNIQFKFVANNEWGAGNWGDNLLTNTVPPIINQQGFASGANAFLSGSPTGWHTFVFVDSNKVFSVIPSGDVDSDGDGLTDAFEGEHGLNPYRAADAFLDTDGDGFAEVEESVAGTEIFAADAFHQVDGLVPAAAGSGAEVSWPAVSGRRYDVWFSTNLTGTPVWAPLVPFTNLAGAGPVSITDTSTAPFRAYRIDVRRP
jgi:alpha-glucosidase